MSTSGSLPADYPSNTIHEAAGGYYVPVTVSKPRYWLHALLLALTLVSTTIIGAWLARDFEANVPPYSGEELDGLLAVVSAPAELWRGLPFSLTLLTILMAHEMGHYLACVYYRVDASLPYFIPFPSPLGTMGAFIRIRAPIHYRDHLFDIGIAGPLAGFVMLVPALAIGLAWSKVLPGIASEGEFQFGSPLLLRGLCALIFPGTSVGDIYLHPMARAAWGGMFATAVNLLPIGQLDGGHILYAFTGSRHRMLSRVFAFVLVPLGFLYWYGWLVWFGLIVLFGLRHPAIYDSRPVARGRILLGLLAAAVFALCFSVAPILSRELTQ